MDEIIIDEKKYVSSKKAAKITGYAKDYIGQLCREGRVPARLVGRSWYVLESALKDHRFGNKITESPGALPNAVIDTTPQEFPRYVASHAEVFPSLNRLDQEIGDSVFSENKKAIDSEPFKDINESWKEWFDTVSSKKETHIDSSYIAVEEEAQAVPLEAPIMTDSIQVHVHHVAQRNDENNFLPNQALEIKGEQALKISRKSTATKLVQITGILLATISVAFACMGSGYFDDNIISNSQAFNLSGGFVYNK